MRETLKNPGWREGVDLVHLGLKLGLMGQRDKQIQGNPRAWLTLTPDKNC